MVRGFGGVNAGSVQEIELYDGLFCWCPIIGTTDEVVLEGLDGAFCCVDSMVVRLDKLYRSILGSHEGLDGHRSLVICDIEGRRETFVG